MEKASAPMVDVVSREQNSSGGLIKCREVTFCDAKSK